MNGSVGAPMSLLSGRGAEREGGGVMQDGANTAEAAWAPPVDLAEGARVLVVDDDAPFRRLAARALSACGHVVIEAESAEDALEVTRNERVDLVVTDVALPGLDGPVWLREARLARPDLPAVIVSGYQESVVAGRFARIPGSVFLEKPAPLERLTRAVRTELARAEAGRRLAQRLAQQGNGSPDSGDAS